LVLKKGKGDPRGKEGGRKITDKKNVIDDGRAKVDWKGAKELPLRKPQNGRGRKKRKVLTQNIPPVRSGRGGAEKVGAGCRVGLGKSEKEATRVQGGPGTA